MNLNTLFADLAGTDHGSAALVFLAILGVMAVACVAVHAYDAALWLVRRAK